MYSSQKLLIWLWAINMFIFIKKSKHKLNSVKYQKAWVQFSSVFLNKLSKVFNFSVFLVNVLKVQIY